MLRIYFLQRWFNRSDPAVEPALYDSVAVRGFVGIDLGREPASDETTSCRFRHLLEEHDPGSRRFEDVHRHLEAKGLKVATGTIVDATIINAPWSTNNRDNARDPAYRRQTDVITAHGPTVKDFTNRRYRHSGVVDEAEWVKNRTESKVRAKVEHAFGAIKRFFGRVKFRYRGLDKNAHRLFATCALANLFMPRRHRLRCQEP
jgi:IS5 family transposase